MSEFRELDSSPRQKAKTNQIFHSAKEKLNAHMFSIEHLPTDDSSPMWNRIEVEFGLTLGELAALQAHVHSRQVQHPAVQPSQSSTALSTIITFDPTAIEEDFADSPYGNLQGCLEHTPDVSTERAIIGPGPCLLDMMKSVSSARKELLKAKIASLRRQIAVNCPSCVSEVDHDLLLAVKLYTIQDPVQLYSYFNHAFNTRSGLESVKPYARCLLRAMRALRSTSLFLSPRAAYRGLKISNNPVLKHKFDDYKTHFAVNNLITMAGFTSVTTEPAVCEEFGDSLFYAIRNACGVNISCLSEYPNENEVLLAPPAVFRIEAAIKVKNVLTVTLVQVEQKTAFYCNFAAYDTSDLYQRGLRFYEGSEGVAPDFVEGVRYFRLAADEGYAEAHYYLGKCFKDGSGVEVDLEETVRQYTVAAEHGHVQARHDLALCYKRGEGVEQNYTQAVKWLRLNAEEGFAESQLHLGLLYMEGKVEHHASKFWKLGRFHAVDDAVEAFKWFQRAAKQNNAEAQVQLGVCYFYGRGTNQQLSKAVHLFWTAAQSNLASAQFWLGECYRHGIGFEKQLGEAVRLFKMAADQGHQQARLHRSACCMKEIGVEREVEDIVQRASELGNDAQAQFELGMCYYHGYGVQKLPWEASRLFQVAAEAGLAGAQYWLGRCYEHGLGVVKDLFEAVRLYKRAANQGHHGAQTSLGFCYYYGVGLCQDYTEALRWYLMAAAENNPDSFNNLGNMYQHGHGVPRDFAEAVKYYQRGIDGGSTTGHPHYNLGSCYLRGEGVTKDLNEALRLFRMAATFGHKDAVTKVTELEAAHHKSKILHTLRHPILALQEVLE